MTPNRHGRGALVVSLDFELYWGVRDVIPLARYRSRLLGARAAIPQILALFQSRCIHATWAVVGFLMCENRDELRRMLPSPLPEYRDSRVSPYIDLDRDVGRDEDDDPVHFAPSLVRKIAATPQQEIGTHTFSHFYCGEDGATIEAFRADIDVAMELMKRFAPRPRSIVFPRNQCEPAYLRECAKAGLDVYRGNPPSQLYRPVPPSRERLVTRAGRLLDAYVPVASRHARGPVVGPIEGISDVPASRFLRPYSPRLRRLEPLRFRRICREMENAAANGRNYHLWWHPHNFGGETAENLAFLTRILDHAERLDAKYGFGSMTMAEAADARLEAHEQAAQ